MHESQARRWSNSYKFAFNSSLLDQAYPKEGTTAGARQYKFSARRRSMGRQKKFYQQPRAAKVLEQKFCTNYLSTSARLCSCDQVEAVLVW